MTLSFNFGDKYGIHRMWYYPYVGFDWKLYKDQMRLFVGFANCY